MKGGERSLKSANMKWLVLLAFADVLAVLLLAMPEMLTGMTKASISRISVITVMPVLILLIINVVPSDVKAMLVYWKPPGVLPGFEAFSKHAPRDPRVDMAALKKNVGELPVEATEQNAKWYKLYLTVQDEPSVAETHRLSLMYRDMATLSLPLAVLVPLSLYLVRPSESVPFLAAAFLAGQYLLTALSARWSGVRLVTNVAAIHSAKRL